MKQNRIHLSARITPLAAVLIAAEQKRTNESEGAIVTRLITEGLSDSSPETKAAWQSYLATDPEMQLTVRVAQRMMGETATTPRTAHIELGPTTEAAMHQIEQTARKAAEKSAQESPGKKAPRNAPHSKGHQTKHS